MQASSIVSSFYTSNFAKDISAPYTNLSAYSAGVIDSQGNLLKPESSIDAYEYLIIKLKKIFEELPSGMLKSSLSSYLPTLRYFSEHSEEYGIKKDEFDLFLEGYILAQTDGEISYLELNEDMSAGGMATPATGGDINQGGISGFDPVMGSMQRRKSVLGFENSCEMFDVCPQEYEGFKSAKSWMAVPKGETRNYLQRFQRRNPNGMMAVRNSETGDIHWLQLKPKSLIEEMGLDNLDIVNESNEKNKGLVTQYNDSDEKADDDQQNVATLRDDQEKEIEVSGQNLSNLISAAEENLRKTGAYQAASSDRGKSFTPAESESWAKTMGLLTSGEFLRSSDPETGAEFLGRWESILPRTPSHRQKIDVQFPEFGADVKSRRATMGIRLAPLLAKGIILPKEVEQFISKSREQSSAGEQAKEEAKQKGIPQEEYKPYTDVQRERQETGGVFKKWLENPTQAKFRDYLGKKFAETSVEDNIPIVVATHPRLPLGIMQPGTFKQFLEQQPLSIQPTRKSGSGEFEGQVQTEKEVFGSKKKVLSLPYDQQISFGETDLENLEHILGTERTPKSLLRQLRLIK